MSQGLDKVQDFSKNRCDIFIIPASNSRTAVHIMSHIWLVTVIYQNT
jgi:hypothetical protein